MSHHVSLQWVASTDPVDGYSIYKGTVSGAETTKVNSALITGTTYDDTTATPGNWFYAVKSSLGGVESVLSNSINAVILPAPPTALTLVASN